MKFTMIVLTAAFVTPLMTSSQDKVAPPNATLTSAGRPTNLRLKVEARTPFVGGLAGKSRCDAEGNIYFRPTDSDTAERYHPTSALPVRRIRPDGSLGGSFSISDTSPGLLATDFFVTTGGKVYQVARSESSRSVYVVSYSPEGSLESKVRLETEFFLPYQVAVFRSGEFLVSGIRGSYNRTPFTAVYGNNGELIREIYEPEDDDARKRAEAGEPGFRPDNMQSSNDFVTHGDVVLGSDGNAYLLRAASPALIYTVSSKGEVVRTLRVDSPTPGLLAAELKSADGLLAIGFLEHGRNTGVIQVVDFRGNSVASYAPEDSRMYPGLLACYTPNRLVFVGLANGDNLRLNIAEPK